MFKISMGFEPRGGAGPNTDNKDAEMQIGPMSILHHAASNHTQVLVSCRHNKKLLGQVKAFDRHMNLVMENVREMWMETTRKGKGKRANVSRDRFISKLFLRGDSIILIIKNPLMKGTGDGSA